MQFCAQDMHNWDVVEGEGFKNLIDTVLFIGRRSNGDPNANTYDPVRRLIPTAKQLKEVRHINKHCNFLGTKSLYVAGIFHPKTSRPLRHRP
jgi:hypothetical protein